MNTTPEEIRLGEPDPRNLLENNGGGNGFETGD